MASQPTIPGLPNDYWDSPVIRQLANRITPASYETAVDGLWTSILSLYFTVQQGYAIEAQVEPNAGSCKRCNITVSPFHHQHGLRKRIFCENKRQSGENDEKVWNAAQKQVRGYLEESKSNEDLYAIVGVGCIVRFYQWKAGPKEMPEILRAQVQDDHDKIHDQLLELRGEMTPAFR
ncbi:hypothetical protein FQN55_002748 [Onygenales sp. PD_40]|nr:hypothetical protein FQN55_002748 [Onygenales sp. PD_40]